MMKYSIFCVLVTFLSCAIPCPKDKKIGSIQFSAATNEFLPKSSNFKSLSFVNEKGDVLVFNTANDKVTSTRKIPIKTLCERGDFLDKTIQMEYLEAPTVNLFYTTSPERFTLAVDITFDGHMPNTAIQDTALIERVSVWAQKISTNAKNGKMSLISSTRGNENHKDLQITLNQPKEFAIVKDTTILTRKIKNAYYNPSKSGGMTIYYTKENSIEAFVTDDGEVWVKK